MIHTTFSCPSGKQLASILGGLLLVMHVSMWPAADARAAEPVAPTLTPKLQKLFAEEMVAILQASQQIIAALVAGDHAMVAKNAQAIHDSFILDRNLTAQDRKALETAVPPAFLELDGAFHQMAAKLAEAARHKDTELQNYYFGRMLETCGTCHRQYATDKFPALGGKTPAGHAH